MSQHFQAAVAAGVWALGQRGMSTPLLLGEHRSSHGTSEVQLCFGAALRALRVQSG